MHRQITATHRGLEQHEPQIPLFEHDAQPPIHGQVSVARLATERVIQPGIRDTAGTWDASSSAAVPNEHHHRSFFFA